MIKLRYQGGNIKLGSKRVNSSEVSEWGNLKNHINSLTSGGDPLIFTHILEGEKIVVAKGSMSNKQTLEWSNLDITLWNVVKAEIEAL